MTFTTWQFGLFVAVVFCVYYLPILQAFQVHLLVLASLFFYGYGQPQLLPMLAIAVLGTYLFLILALRQRAIWLPVDRLQSRAPGFFKYKFLFFDPSRHRCPNPDLRFSVTATAADWHFFFCISQH